MQASQIEQLSRMSSPNVHVSLHIPLHRTLSAILAKLVLLPWNEEKEGFLSKLQLDYSEDEVYFMHKEPTDPLIFTRTSFYLDGK